MTSKRVTEMQVLQTEAMEKLKLERNKQTPIYVGDVENMLQKVAQYVPMFDNEAIYLAELETQHKFFLAFAIMGALMFILGMML